MRITFIGKRIYTNRDAILDQYGRIYQLPHHWSNLGTANDLWLIDYHRKEHICESSGNFSVKSTPIFKRSFWQELRDIIQRKHEPNDIIVASGDCYIGLLAYNIAKQKRVKFVFDVYDKYDEFSGHFNLPGFNLLKFLISKANICLFASKKLMRELSQDQENDILVPNGIDGKRFDRLSKTDSRKKFRISEKAILIGYFGGMEPDRGVEDLISAVKIVRSQGVPIQLVMGGANPPNLDLNAQAVCYLGNIPYIDMPEILACCDLLSIPYRRSPFMDSGSSNKIAEYIASRRPIVATETPNLTENFPTQAKKLSGLLAKPGNPSDIARTILLQFKSPILLDMPSNMMWNEIARYSLERLKD
ncbi:glycosyltransferase [Microbulbifer echini]|uniref:Glycosyltransferase n=1 Tax=Microbulbifer echini TaxID=1529067 RepID=A0ABV4NNJ7_9GAMM